MIMNHDQAIRAVPCSGTLTLSSGYKKQRLLTPGD
jgi:hypothetical protein